MPPTAEKTTDPREYTDKELGLAVLHLHRGQGAKDPKVGPGDVVCKNAKNQLVITSIDRARDHARYLDSLPPGHEDLAPPPGQADPDDDQ